MTPNDWEEKESLEWGGEWWSDKQRVWSVWLCPSFVFGLRGGRLAEAGRLAALAQSQATHCATLPRKSPGLRGTGGWGGTSSLPPPHGTSTGPRGPIVSPFQPLDTSGPLSLVRTSSPWQCAVAVGLQTCLQSNLSRNGLDLIGQTQE